jgi:structural maintenance of chromosome 1
VEHSSQKERRMADAVAEMKRRFPGDVYGRLCDICKPNSSKYNVAITVLMGRQMDSVVVHTFSTAMACLHLLKELRCEPMEFVPLDNIQVSPPSCQGSNEFGSKQGCASG